jgi:hypothetical protein
MSRSIIWGLARQKGFDPTRWRLEGAGLVTWGGEKFNTLLAALFMRQSTGRRFAALPEEVNGPIFAVDVSVDAIRMAEGASPFFFAVHESGGGPSPPRRPPATGSAVWGGPAVPASRLQSLSVTQSGPSRSLRVCINYKRFRAVTDRQLVLIGQQCAVGHRRRQISKALLIAIGSDFDLLAMLK